MKDSTVPDSVNIDRIKEITHNNPTSFCIRRKVLGLVFCI